MRRASLLFLTCCALAGISASTTWGGRTADPGCGTKVPAEAQRVFDELVSAYRSANARAIVNLMERTKDARLLLSLQDVPRDTYASAQALGILENTYFKKHSVTSLTESKDCPKGEGAAFSRTFLLTTKTDATESSEHLSVRVHRIDLENKTSYWVLESLESKLIPRK